MAQVETTENADAIIHNILVLCRQKELTCVLVIQQTKIVRVILNSAAKNRF